MRAPPIFDLIIIDHSQLLDLTTQTLLVQLRREMSAKSNLKLMFLVTGHDTEFIAQVAHYMEGISSQHISIALPAQILLPPTIIERKIRKPSTNQIGDILINFHAVFQKKAKFDPLYECDFVVYLESMTQAEELRIMLTMAALSIRQKRLNILKPIELSQFYSKVMINRYLFEPPKEDYRRVFLLPSEDVNLPLSNKIVFDFGLKRVNKLTMINKEVKRIQKVESISEREQLLRSSRGVLVYRLYSQEIKNESQAMDVGVESMQFVSDMAGLQLRESEILQFDTLLINPDLKVETYHSLKKALVELKEKQIITVANNQRLRLTQKGWMIKESGLPLKLAYLPVKALLDHPYYFFHFVKLGCALYAQQLWGAPLYSTTLLQRDFQLEHFCQGLQSFQAPPPINKKQILFERQKFGKNPYLQLINFITTMRSIPRQGREGETERLVMKIGQFYALNPNYLLLINNIIQETLSHFLNQQTELKYRFRKINFQKVRPSFSLLDTIKLSSPWDLMDGDGFSTNKNRLSLDYSSDEESSIELEL